MASPIDSGPGCWAIAGDAKLSLREWEGEFAVFNPCSGHTHILDFAAGTLLSVLSGGPRSEAELARLIASTLELPEDDALHESLRALLRQLDEQGLIAAVSLC